MWYDFVMNIHEIEERLFSLQDLKFRDFHRKLIPDVEGERVIGVRTPDLKKLAKEIYRSDRNAAEDFMKSLPHGFYDENQLHAFLLCEEKDFDRCICGVEAFLPYVDNWATCDQLSPAVFKKHHDKLLPYIRKWLESARTYSVRFAMGMLMRYFLDDDFKAEYMETVAAFKSDEYYIKMMQAWYFATALAKQYECAVSFLRENRLEKWTHNKTVQKACESFRITADQKEELKKLRRI